MTAAHEIDPDLRPDPDPLDLYPELEDECRAQESAPGVPPPPIPAQPRAPRPAFVPEPMTWPQRRRLALRHAGRVTGFLLALPVAAILLALWAAGMGFGMMAITRLPVGVVIGGGALLCVWYGYVLGRDSKR